MCYCSVLLQCIIVVYYCSVLLQCIIVVYYNNCSVLLYYNISDELGGTLLPGEVQYCVRVGNGGDPPVVLLDGSEPSFFTAHLTVVSNVSLMLLVKWAGV